MNLPIRFEPLGRLTLASLCALFLAGCQADLVALSPPMRTRVLDGTTKLPIDHVRVTLVSRDTTDRVTAYSDRNGFIHMPSLVGEDHVILRHLTDTPRSAVRAVFDHPGYVTYSVDSVNGYGFFRGFNDVHLYPDTVYPEPLAVPVASEDASAAPSR